MRNLFLGLAAIGLVFLALFSGPHSFSGADQQAVALISEISPDYRPWAWPLWRPPSPEVESFLFALQAAVGSGFLCYYLGLGRGRTLARKDHDPPN
ncbi:MAG TPA: energy-coupling factor ABC transporter substrate-binding protein [Cyanobacteria bacterium UBA8530]|nr:energy-coupling factor ABC transporter substrate-binding protein [Cyanobacteria bacterium UBA8530]